MQKKIYKIKGMDCASCASLIELDLEDVGVTAKCSFPKETLEVEFDPKKVSEEKIKTVVKTSGYQLS
ncbi:cation transporter [Candidatus Woesebacteria bacterium]|nr:cation transporter [Candidatus Woesebacteria bacterium]